MEFYGTLGTACREESVLSALFAKGMTGLRLNLSHTGLDGCDALNTGAVARAAGKAGIVPRLAIDLQGPELRIGVLKEPVLLRPGTEVTLGCGGIPVPPAVLSHAAVGTELSLDDSALLLCVLRREREALYCAVLRGGTLQSRKSLALLGTEVDSPTLTGEDLKNLDLAGKYGVTHVMLPFVRGREDVDTLRDALDARGLSGVRIMAKIENRQGLRHLEDILSVADEICIARGDLGNAMPLWELPAVQKHIARRCVRRERPFCLVTQLLWSMEQRPVPTRAEVLDIFNGVLDGASALMLTGETAVGRCPVQAMEYLVRTAGRAEDYLAQERET